MGASTHRDTVIISAADRRCPMGQRVEPGEDPYDVFMMPVDDVHVRADSDEAHWAGAAFDPGVIPSAGDLVPVSSAWACFPHPGPLPSPTSERAATWRTLSADLAGRTFSELVAHLGEPRARDDEQFGTDLELSDVSMALWEYRTGLRKHSMIVFFDAFDVSFGDLNSLLSAWYGQPTSHAARQQWRRTRTLLREQILERSLEANPERHIA